MGNQNKKTEVVEKIVAIFSAIVSIILVNRDWVVVEKGLEWTGYTVTEGYNLYQMGFSYMAIILIVSHVVGIILTLANAKIRMGYTEGVLAVNIMMVIACILYVNFLNSESKGYIDIIEYKLSFNLYLLIGFSILMLMLCYAAKRERRNNATPVVQNIEVQTIKCKQCGAELKKGTAFCNECGSKIALQNYSKYCSKCGEKMPENTIFCPKCRHRNG